jgi:ABC-type bacteriocin/lantibiotic exporter with double-glycine peptidase domain
MVSSNSGRARPPGAPYRMTFFARVRTPLRPQFQTTECGVAVLRIMFAHLGFEPTTAEIRRVSGVSRDCVSATDIRRTARAFGFECKALSVEPAALKTMALPIIVHLNFIHFVVLEGFEGHRMRLNCPASGRIALGLQEFDAMFTGVVLAITPTDRSPSSARESKAELAWWLWFARAMSPDLSAALRSRILRRLKTLPLDFFSYRLPEVLYALVTSAQGMTARIYNLLAPAVIGLACALALIAWLTVTAPRIATSFALVFTVWLVWVWVWSTWHRTSEWTAAADANLIDFIVHILALPQSAKLADGPERTWRLLRSRRAQFQLMDIQVRVAVTMLRYAPALLLVALLSTLGFAEEAAPISEGVVLIVVAAAIVGLVTPLTRLRGVASALRRDGFQWRDVLEEPIPAKTCIPAPPPGAVVVLKDVAFAFTPTKPEVFSKVDLRIEVGEQIGLVGPSGCGKSTLTKLIMGVYAPTRGTVSVLGQEAEGAARGFKIARIDRQATMFEGTIRENLTLWDNQISQADVEAAVADAGLGPALAGRRGGLNAHVESFGVNFSGGQLQRLEIARALVRNPFLLILDDAIDALDFDSELEIRSALRRRGCALILASHRANSIAACDRIFHLKEEREQTDRPPAADWAGSGLALISGRAAAAAGDKLDGPSDALYDTLDQLLAASPSRLRTDLSGFTLGEALSSVAQTGGYRLQRLKFTEPAWWRADFGKVLAFTPEGVPKPLVAARLSRTERLAAAATYREEAYAFAPIRVERISSITDWLRGAIGRGWREAARALAATAAFAAGLVVIVAGLGVPLTPVRGAALAILVACEVALLAFQGIAVQRFESAVRQWCIDGFSALLTRFSGDVLAHLSQSVVDRGLNGLDRLTQRLIEAVGKAIPAAFALMAGLFALGLLGGVGPFEMAALLSGGVLLIQLAGCGASDVTSGKEPNAGLEARRHLAVIIWGLTKLRLLGVADQAFERWVRLDDRWRGLRNRKRLAAALVAGSQGLATLFLIGWLAGRGRTMLDRALLGAIGWMTARSAIVIGELLKNLIEDWRPAIGVRALLREAQTNGSMKVDPARATISVQRATVRYAGCRSPALVDVSVEIDPGGLTVLAGPSGGGKSTLLRVILGLQRLERGVVCVGGHPMDAVDVADWRRRVAGVFQGDKLEDTVTIRGHLCRGAEYALHDIWAALEAVELAEDVRVMPMGLQSIIEAGSFSTGQQQRLLIAAALLQKPALMVLDEATNAIPDSIQARIVVRLRGRGVGCVVVTHRQTLIDLADRVHVLEAGRVVYSGAPQKDISGFAAFSAREGAQV